MRITLSKLITAKWESDDPATDGFKSTERIFGNEIVRGRDK